MAKKTQPKEVKKEVKLIKKKPVAEPAKTKEPPPERPYYGLQDVQDHLVAIGKLAPKFATGEENVKSSEALAAFQRDHHLPGTGIVTDETLLAMWPPKADE